MTPTISIHLLLPLASGFGYVLAVMLIKRSECHGVGLWRTTFVSNLAMAVCFAPFWLLGGAPVEWGDSWRPAVTAVFFFLGQVMTFLALAGEISVATPVLGLKIIMVALLSTLLLAGNVPLVWWAAAGLSTLAIGLLNRPIKGVIQGKDVGRTVVFAAGAALFFALSDVLVQKWAPLMGVGRFLPIMFGFLGLFSFGLIPFFSAPLRMVPRPAWPWLLIGSVVLALQAAGVVWTLATHGDATAANVMYSSRGLWSVAMVWMIGHWFGNTEGKLPPAVLGRRLTGATLMMAAIALALWSP